ncbi:gamma-glutamylcyclotransferase [Thalassobaculum sp. OXR-137]|uniref:gamma-glutamylcyclotransferase n=1 Tax=Thalassobaculum sp. OXR-137 TaxID=3100173 RepID=UPI002AC90009|nr:gamma-glutamylcyclotransferase [Thalassobaculum sp. OXR-137]WPZ35768.1 gamma-glutamylcyclotransferase [Thalassobaculum sp. OXR-137]
MTGQDGSIEAGDIWVFGYGSLMWRPGFHHVERADALLRGYRRRLCVVSRHHRGTAARPGLVMGLDRGGACRGVAYRVPEAGVPETLAYLDEREIAHYPVYRRSMVTVDLGGGRRQRAVTYIVDRREADYAGALTVEQQAAIVAGAHGLSGPNPDYLRQTVAKVHAMGLRDRSLEAVLAALTEPSAATEEIARLTLGY